MVAGERLLAGEDLVGDDAEREDVGPRVERLAADLLRREVRGGAERDPGLREGRRGDHRLRDAEVHDLHGAVVEDPDVRGLDVAVDDPGRVRVAEPLADVEEDLDLPVEREGDLLLEEACRGPRR